MTRVCVFALIAVLAANVVRADSAVLPESVEFREDGRFSLNGMNFSIAAFDRNWQNAPNEKWREVKSVKNRSELSVKGVILLDGAKGTVAETIRPAGSGAFTVESSVSFRPPLQLNRVAGTVSLPIGKSSITIDGKPLAVPEKNGDVKLYFGSPREIVLRGYGAEELAVTGMDKVHIQDNRKFKQDTVSVMFLFSPSAGEIGDAVLKLHVQPKGIEGRRIALDPFVNRAFRDEPGAPVPGWTAQGPEMDLRLFPPGRITAKGMQFDVSPAGAVAVGGELRGGVPAEVTVPVSVDGGARSLNLLHTSAWTPNREFGLLTVKFADGSTKEFPVSGLRDCGNWFRPRELPNAAVAWVGKRPDADVGIYFSTFALPEKTQPVSVTFRSTDPNVIWLVLGMTFADKELLFPEETARESRISAGAEWHPLKFKNRTAKGSPLDFSGQLDAPAGKYGFARPAADGSLRFEQAPERRLKLYGTNLCQSANFPTKETAEQMAEQIARSGCNAVRFHHHDNGLTSPGAADSTTLDPEALDRFDYLFAALKKRGIYLTTDLYTSRVFREGDGIPGDFSQPKALFPIEPAAMENWKKFVRNWMTHRNPYTGLTYAEDPALVMVNLVNEDNLDSVWNRVVANRDRYAARFEEWKKEHNCPDARADRGDRRFLEFLLELQGKSLAEMARFVREELKVQAAVTSLNYHYDTYLAPLRDTFDVVDTHQYHSHPSFLGKQWASRRMHGQSSALSGMASLPRGMMPTRITGKPFFVTEFNYCNPNRYRAEGGPLLGGYAALQDWDGLYRFCYTHNIKRFEDEAMAVSAFESVNEPLMQLSDRIIAMLFLRGDVAPAPEGVSFPVAKNALRTDLPYSFPTSFQMLGLVTRIGSHIEGRALPDKVKALADADDWSAAGKNAGLWKQAAERKQAVSSTGELRLDGGKETFSIRTPRTESVTLPKGALSTGGVLSVSGAKTFQTVAATSLDGEPLEKSRDILLLHLTNVSNSDAVFADQEQRIVNDQGKLPLLVRRARTQVTLGGAPFRVTALSADGDPLGEVTVNGNTFTAGTDLFPDGVMAYRITR